MRAGGGTRARRSPCRRDVAWKHDLGWRRSAAGASTREGSTRIGSPALASGLGSRALASSSLTPSHPRTRAPRPQARALYAQTFRSGRAAAPRACVGTSRSLRPSPTGRSPQCAYRGTFRCAVVAARRLRELRELAPAVAGRDLRKRAHAHALLQDASFRDESSSLQPAQSRPCPQGALAQGRWKGETCARASLPGGCRARRCPPLSRSFPSPGFSPARTTRTAGECHSRGFACWTH